MFKIDIQSFFNDKKFKNTVEALKLVRHFIPKKYTYYSAKELYQELNKKSIEEICQYFKIQLISNEKTKIPSKSYLENNKIIIEFKDNKENTNKNNNATRTFFVVDFGALKTQEFSMGK
ncbi:hypothetical protein, partial [Campylobacter lari]|uniref:hypothetical protein n=1 Tax=Campylobacter lari TaxID=201 RepID=UPI001BDAB244